MRRSGRHVGLRSLVATALLAGVLAVVASSSPVQAAGYDADCELLPDDAVTVADVTGWRDALSSGAVSGIKRFNRVLEAFGVDTESGVSAMTVEQAQAVSAWLGNTRWDRIARTMAALEQCADAPPPPPTPEVSISGGNGVTEGADATFTVTASPAPAASLDVTVSVTQSGDFVTVGAQTVSISTTGSATLTVATDDDSVDEADGSVTATVDAGSGYTVSSTNGSATVAVADNDVTPDPDPVPQVDHGCVSGSLRSVVHRYYDVNQNRPPSYGRNWKRVLIAFGELEDSTLEPYTSAEALVSESRWSGWRPIREALECIEAAAADPDPDPDPVIVPVVSVSGGSGVTEGGNAVFTVTANPAPTANLHVTVSVTQSGDFATTGTQTVTIPTGGSATLTVATTNDSVDEADGSVTATVDAGSGYTVSSTNGSATVAVQDDDDPPPVPVPVVSISGGNAVTEGGDVTFTVTANPAPSASLDVTVSVSQSGDFATAGTQTVTVPTGGSATLTVATTDDSADEPDGSVTATVGAGNGYTVSSTAGSATVAVRDDDVAQQQKASVKPEINVTAGSDIVEGEDAVFTITATPAPSSRLKVFISIRQDGRFLQSGGEDRFFWIPPSGSATLREATIDDTAIEDNGSVTVYVGYLSGRYNVGANWNATLAVADNDTKQVDSRPPRTDVTWADFWAPYEDLIAEAEEVRNDPVLRLSRQHTDRWDRVLLAFGREVADDKLQAMTAAEAERLRLGGNTLFERVAPAIKKIEGEVAEHGPWPVNPGEAPTQTTAFPGHIAVTGGATSKTLTLTDYFSDPEGEDLTFTASISGSTMTATLNGADVTLALNPGLSRGGGDLTVTASDGQLTDTATAHVVVGCGTSSTWNEKWNSCFSAATSNSFSGSVDGDHPGSGNTYIDEHTARANRFEGNSGQIRVFVFPDVLNDTNPSNDSTCIMRGYLTLTDLDGTAITDPASKETGTWSVRVSGTGFTNNQSANNRSGTDDVAGTGNPGWNDSGCSNAALTAHKARLAIVEYSIPNDGRPGTELNGVLLKYHDIGASGTTVQGTHDVMSVSISDTIDSVGIARSSGINQTHAVGEGTGPGSSDLVLLSTGRLLGYVAAVVDGAVPNERPDLTLTSSNPQNGWWTVVDGSNRSTYFNSTIWAHINQAVLPKWTSSGTYGVSSGVWHNDAVWIRGSSGDYDAGDEPGGSNDGWAPLVRSGNTFTSGYAGSNNGQGRAAPAPIPAWAPDGNYGYDAAEHTLVWNEHNKRLYRREQVKIGFFVPVDNFDEQRLAAYRDNGPASQIGLRLSGGGKWPWLDNQDCMFNTHLGGGTVDTCTISWNWPDNGYYQDEQKIELWWVELESYDPHAPVKYRTKLSTLILRDSGQTGPTPHTGNYWIEFENVNGSGYSATATQPLKETHSDYVNRQDHVSGYIVTNQNPIRTGSAIDRVVAVEVRRGTTAAGARANFKQPLNKYVGRSSFTIDGQAHREFYLQDSATTPCNLSGFNHSCFGGEGKWTKVSGRNLWRTPLNLVVHDDNYVGEKLRYYVFNVKDSTSGNNPTLEVKEDDHLQITLQEDLARNGKMHIHSHRASYQHYSFRLEERGSVDGETGWDQWDVTIEANWHGSASSYSLGDDSKGPDEHPGCPRSGAGWVRAVFTNSDALFHGVEFAPGPSPSDRDYQPDTADTKYSGWVQVCK